MRLGNLDALVAVLLAGSLAMERLVTVVKTVLPQTFGEPGARPGGVFEILDDTRKGSLWTTQEQTRRLRVLALVFAASFATSYLLSDVRPSCTWPSPCRDVVYGDNLAINLVHTAVP